jgi:hypothetical protein
MKTSELQGAALDWAVAKCEGNIGHELKDFCLVHMEDPDLQYSTNWAQGGPIIEREGISIVRDEGDLCWQAVIDCHSGSMFGSNLCGSFWHEGPTPLIAAMRCYVASKMGDEVEIPEGLK